MQEIFREEFWRKRGRPRELYSDTSSKDAPVPPDLPILNCDCGFPTHVFQSKHPDIAAWCFYTYSRFNVRNYFYYPFYLFEYATNILLESRCVGP